MIKETNDKQVRKESIEQLNDSGELFDLLDTQSRIAEYQHDAIQNLKESE